MSSHNSPECDGRWIDISTLAQRKVLCLKCRATVEGVSDPDDERLAASPVALAEPVAELGTWTETTEAGQAWFLSPWATLALAALALVVAAFSVGLAVGLRLAL